MERFIITPSGISHNQSPVFHAVWFNGEEAEENRSEHSYFFEASGDSDRLLISRIVWDDEKPESEKYNILMDESITALDNWISERM
ncbi:hypothetical protein BMETH_625_2 [methanotrophic bacterial endosymbiont of Bathymodiolus sp.]|jgi:hypothetical protein|nr:hypothetical protein BMETH_625_2 [methanotrophic bacterial endosymbiont of Bathymodiolus sp.]